jgi:hypothetical protein
MPKKEKVKKTVGEISTDLLQKANDPVSVIDQTYECLTDFEKELLKCAHDARTKYKGNYFITVITKKEPLMENVIRNFFIHRLSCPTPDYDQTVYRYDRQKDDLEFIWTIPSKDTCLQFIAHKHEIVPSELALLGFILDFSDGTLFKLAKKLNNESDFSPNLAIIRSTADN